MTTLSRFVALAAATVPLLLAAPARALERPAFSADGSTVVGLGAGGALLAVDASTGRERWRVELGRRLARGLESVQATGDGDGALVVARGDLWWAGGGEQRPRRLTETGSTRGGLLSPAGAHAAFVREGALWLVDLADGRETRLAPGPVASRDSLSPAARQATPHGFAWSPEGRSIAFLTGGEGARAVAVVDLVTPGELRLLELDLSAGRRIDGMRWRFDGLALAVVSRVESGWDELTLCHPAKLHCRLLASRPSFAPTLGPDALAFYSNGFLWSRAGDDGAGIVLASHDTLGRERGRIELPGWRVVGLEAVVEEVGRIVVAAREEKPGAPVRWLVLDAAGRAEPRPIGSADAETLLFAADGMRFVRSRLRAGEISAQTVEGLDGRVLAELPVPR